MALFRYRGVTAAGDLEMGEMEVANQDAAIERVQSLGLIPLEVEAATGGRAAQQSGLGWLNRRKISQDQVTTLTRELATLLRSGLPLDRALEILIGLSDQEAARDMLEKIRDDVRGGAALSAAMEGHPQVFGRFYLSMIRAGEAGGALGDVLTRITEFMERAKELKETVGSALIYPAILILASAISVLLLLIFVVPQFTQMFAESGKELPLPTQVVVGTGNLLRSHGWAIAMAAGALIYLFRRALERPATRYQWDGRLLGLPLIGDLIRKIEVARFSRTLGTLLVNGVPLLGALSIVKDTVGNRVIAAGLGRVREKLQEGHGFGKMLLEEGHFPKLAIHMITVGEETGELDTMLARIADVFDREVQLQVKRALSLLEPVMILGLGLVIGGIIMSILMAILEVNSLVG